MKKLLIIIPLLISFFSCKKEEVIMNDSTELQQQSAWKSEEFKWDYTIQFPRYYNGGYVQGFEGGTFDKLRDDTRTHFFYSFTNGLQYFDFGDTLTDESVDSIAFGDMMTILPYRLDFTENGQTVGILFYNDVWSISTCVLYWKDGGVFKNALQVGDANDMKEEMLTI
ncbi:MAG: hypothetical protein ABI729_07130, partial [Chitinophagales bacterium]